MTASRQVERYSLDSSPFYRIGRNKDLAELLNISVKKMRDLIVKRSVLYRIRDEDINGKHRSLAVPIDEMRRVHERVQGLLGRIILPNYIYSPRRGRTSINNASVHSNSNMIIKLDVKQFYPSTTDEHVFQFFHHRLRMASDIAGRLTKICTINGKVPFGSPVSPILCALTHNDIFLNASNQCELNDNVLTLWVDDITISGSDVNLSIVRNIKRLIASKRLKPHKSQRASGSRGVVITGAFVGPRGLAPANKSHLKLDAKLREFETELDINKRFKLVQSIIGMLNYHLAVYPNDSENYARVKRRLQWFHGEFRKIKILVFHGSQPISSINSTKITDESTIPWI